MAGPEIRHGTHTSGFHVRKSVNAIENVVSIAVQVSPDLII